MPDITSLKADGICRQPQHHCHKRGEPHPHGRAEKIHRGKQGQEDKSILPRVPQEGRDRAVKRVHAPEDSGLLGLSHAYFAPHGLKLDIKQRKSFRNFQIGPLIILESCSSIKTKTLKARRNCCDHPHVFHQPLLQHVITSG